MTAKNLTLSVRIPNCQPNLICNLISNMQDTRLTISGQALWQWRCQALTLAISAQIPTNEIDWLLRELIGIEPLALRLESFKDWPTIPIPMTLEELTDLWEKRITQKTPIQYLAGITPWHQFSLIVSPAVLIPRPETECLVDLAIDGAQRAGLTAGHWVDLGTGSGAIACALGLGLSEANIHAVDVSEDALIIAQKNIDRLNLSNRIKVYHGSWWQPLNHLQGNIIGMISNPPYIPSNLISTLQPEVVNHEPHLALDGGIDGLDYIRHLIKSAPNYLKPGSLWLVETMAGQANLVKQMLENNGNYRDIKTSQDLAGIERFVIALTQ